LPFIALLQAYPVDDLNDPEGRAKQAQAALVDLGFQAKVLNSGNYILVSGAYTVAPTAAAYYYVYVDGQTADEAKASCAAVTSAAPTLSTAQCTQFTVTPKTESEPASATP
jgi:hypothetical protein